MKIALSSLALIFIAAAPLPAATLIQETFAVAAPGGSVPANWTATDPDAVEIATLAGVNYQRIFRSNALGGSSAIYYTGSQGEVSGGIIADFSSSIVFRMGGTFPQNQTLRGLIFRTQSTSLSAPNADTFWGYSLGVIATGTSRGLYLYENPTSVASTGYGSLLASGSLSDDLVANTQYTLNLSAVGQEITASLWAPGGASAITSLSFQNARTTAGYFGLRSAHANSVANTSYRDLSLNVYAVPEPGAFAMALLGGAALFVRRRGSKTL